MSMHTQRLLSEARVILLQLKNEERRSINPYASFAAQMVSLIQKGVVSGRDEILQLTRMSYARPRMNRQWRTFGSVLQKNLRATGRDSLLYLFGYLKRLITIEVKNEFDLKRRNKMDFKKPSREFYRKY